MEYLLVPATELWQNKPGYLKQATSTVDVVKPWQESGILEKFTFSPFNWFVGYQ